MELYIGLMSGTSADGIDAALIDFGSDQPRLMGTHYIAYSDSLRQRILALCQPGENEIQRLGELDVLLGKEFALAVKQLLQKSNISAEQIKAIGSHGQTIRHIPTGNYRFTIQIGDPNIIAASTEITTIADFRRKDMALHGQGAPLVPAFHQQMFSNPSINRAIVNIGGIANVTLLEASNPLSVIGYDTGPGNALMDDWISTHQSSKYDANGDWAASGKIHEPLLASLLDDPYFQQVAPKSTGREHFNSIWLKNKLTSLSALSPVDVQATLAELTARSIIDSILKHYKHGDILVCGGGGQNKHLMKRLEVLAQNNFKVASTEQYGLHPDWVEATAFAWLAKQTLGKQPGNISSVTGATRAAILGGIYYP
ncbi:MAG: anhydro-N-acetylmuramic acid kinase [Gammaproteobacteria bacterium]